MTTVHAARYQVIPGTLRCRLGQHRRFNFYKTLILEKTAQGLGDLVPLADVLMHEITAQVDITVFESQRFVHVRFIQLEWQCVRLVKDFNCVRHDFNHAGGQLRVFRASRSIANLARYLENIFTTALLGDCKGLCLVRIAYDLRNALAITKIDKNYTTMVTTCVHPAAQIERGADIWFADVSAKLSTHYLLPAFLFLFAIFSSFSADVCGNITPADKISFKPSSTGKSK